MRLKPHEVTHIIQAFEEVLNTAKISYDSSVLFLYGSRIHDNRKGGDIDLLFQVPQNFVSKISELRVRLILKLHEKLGEQRIDLKVSGPTPKDEFTKLILKSAIPLKKWPKEKK